ncbi:MAG: hypothetical protein Q9173_003916 [Seirophora scorigena]
MAPNRVYSVEQIMSLTVEDTQDPDFVNLEIKGWQKFTPKEKERSPRGLKIQRDELAQSSAVDADLLTDKLKRVERSRSATPYNPNPWQPDDLERLEKEAHDALVKDNGRPCYPIELGFDIFDNPGQYKEILEYWQYGKSSDRRVFLRQLRDWELVRRNQRDVRRWYIRRNRFHEYRVSVLERRRKHKLDGDPQLYKNMAEQSKVDDWMEYQHYVLWEYEELEKDFEKYQRRLAFRRKALAELGYSAFEEIEGLESGKYYAMARDWGEKEGKAKRKEALAERKLRMAKKRSEAAQLEELGERVERDRWIGWFTKEVESQRTRLDELRRLADEAKRDVEPYNQWRDAIYKAWDEKGWNENTDEGRRLIELEANSAEYQTRSDKWRELQNRVWDARHAHFCTGEEVEFAEELLEAARTEDLPLTVERAALIKRTQKEVRFAEIHVEEEKEPTKVLDLKRRVLDGLQSVRSVKTLMERCNVKLDWIERQRRELAGDSASTGRGSGPSRSTAVGSGAHRSPGATEASSVDDHPAKKRARLQKPSIAKSILSPVNPAKVSKASSRRRSPHQEMGALSNTSRMAGKITIDYGTPESRIEQASYVRNATPASLRPIHPSRVSKPGRKWRSGQRNNGKKASTTSICGEVESRTSLRLSTGGRSARASGDMPLRRSKRRPKQPERFCAC